MESLEKIRYLIKTKKDLLNELKKYDQDDMDKLMIKIVGHSREWDASIFTLSMVLGILEGMNEQLNKVLKIT